MAPFDYRNKVVLAPMVRIGELPTRLLALHHGADLVWGPETIDRAILNTARTINPRTNCIEYTNKQGRVIYRIHPSEQTRLVYQMGSADPELAVQAAKVVAGDVAGVDLNCGCPKHFSIQGGMGAALLKDVPRLEKILRALVEEVGKVYDIGISCKIRLLATDEETHDMVRRLCRTGIVGLTVSFCAVMDGLILGTLSDDTDAEYREGTVGSDTGSRGGVSGRRRALSCKWRC